MIRRLLVLASAIALAAGAAVIPQPEEPPEPLAGLILDAGLGSPVDRSIWYCPWAQSNAARDTFLAVASMDTATASFTFPVVIAGEEDDTAEVEVLGPGAAGLVLSDVAQRGDSPSLIEFSAGPAAASTTVTGQVLAADACVASGPDTWFLPGGSTMGSEELTLRLLNPFPETAKVTVTAVSELGVEALGELRSVSIGPRSWQDYRFDELLRQRQNLVVAVTAEEGLVVPAMALGVDDDEAWWPGVDVSQIWEFPIARIEDTDAEVVVVNPGVTSVSATIDLFTPDGVRLDPIELTVDPDTPARVALTEGDHPVLGARVTATGPVASAVVARGEGGIAVTPGAPASARDWLVPGVRTVGFETGSLWLLNADESAVSVTVSMLSSGVPVGETFVLDAGTIRRIPTEEAAGYLVEASAPLSVAWGLEGPSGITFATGSAVPEDG